MISFGFNQCFMQGFLSSNSLGFFGVSPRVFKISFRIQTRENKTKELGFHVGILWRFTSLRGFMSGFFWVSVGFHVGFDLGILSGFIQGLIQSFVQDFLSENLVKVFKHSCGFLESFFRVSFRISFTRWGIKKNKGPLYFDKISCTCAAQPCTCAAQHQLYNNRAKNIVYIYTYIYLSNYYTVTQIHEPIK